jgi:hypothetical protein
VAPHGSKSESCPDEVEVDAVMATKAAEACGAVGQFKQAFDGKGLASQFFDDGRLWQGALDGGLQKRRNESADINPAESMLETIEPGGGARRGGWLSGRGGGGAQPGETNPGRRGPGQRRDDGPSFMETLGLRYQLEDTCVPKLCLTRDPEDPGVAFLSASQSQSTSCRRPHQ